MSIRYSADRPVGFVTSGNDQAQLGPTQLDQLQRLGDLGWSVWDLSTGEERWSDRLYVIFERDPAKGPIRLDRLVEEVVPDDRATVTDALHAVLERGEPFDTELRIGRGVATRHVRLMAEPSPLGTPTAVRCVYQDVTGRRHNEEELASSREQLEEQRRHAAEEQWIAVELQRSILPLPRKPVRKPGLSAAVRYLPAGSDSRVGGDWYETSAIDGEGVFIAIGDVSGHGLMAARAMARLRNALSGLAFTGASPDRLLGWLNRVVLAWPESLTATVIAGRYDPAARTLTWAAAGHLPPVLLREGTATTLQTPDGILLGASDDPQFEARTLELLPDDLLLLYTDGLVERRDRDLHEGLDLLVGAVASAPNGETDRVLDHVLSTFEAPNLNDDTCVVAIRFT